MTTIAAALKSRTVWYAIIIAVASVAQGYVFLLPITPVHQMMTGIGIAVGIIIFRFITTEPISGK